MPFKEKAACAVLAGEARTIGAQDPGTGPDRDLLSLLGLARCRQEAKVLDLQPIHFQGRNVTALCAFALQAQAFRAVPHQSIENRSARGRVGLLGKCLKQGEEALAIGIVHRQGGHLGTRLGRGLARAPFAKFDHLAHPDHIVGHLPEARTGRVASADGNGAPGGCQGGIGQDIAVVAHRLGFDEALAR